MPNGTPITTREVNFLFTGLFFFSFPNSNETSPPFKRPEGIVGILSTRKGTKRDHELFISLRGTGVPSEAITIPHSVLSTLRQDIYVEKSTGVRVDDVTIHGSNTEPNRWGVPLDRNDSTGSNRNDFNWIIDFEGAGLHPTNITKNPNALRPKLRFKTGDFFTALITRERFFTIHNGTVQHFGHVAEILGVKIVLTDVEQLVIRANGTSHVVPSDITEIRLENVRPEHHHEIVKQQAGQQETKHTPQDDLKIYYEDLLTSIGEGDRFQFAPVPMSIVAVSPPFVCYGTGGGRSGG